MEFQRNENKGSLFVDFLDKEIKYDLKEMRLREFRIRLKGDDNEGR